MLDENVIHTCRCLSKVETSWKQEIVCEAEGISFLITWIPFISSFCQTLSNNVFPLLFCFVLSFFTFSHFTSIFVALMPNTFLLYFHIKCNSSQEFVIVFIIKNICFRSKVIFRNQNHESENFQLSPVVKSHKRVSFLTNFLKHKKIWEAFHFHRFVFLISS